ncbi:MAG: glycosyltransferase, partial [Myxococcota bacterium]
GVPVALLEAMAAGLPVVSTAVSGIPELVDDTVGWLVPPDDPHALLGALRAACGDRSARVARGQAARRRILTEGWTVDRQVDGLLAAFRV